MHRRPSRGFSLIELMLALALGVIVTAGIVQLFVGNNETYTLLTGQARMQENARYALGFISRSARRAGYLGCDPDADKIYSTLNGATPPEGPWNQLFEFDITQPIQAFDALGTGNGVNDWSPDLGSLPRNTGASTSVNTLVAGNGIDLSTVDQDSDILVLRSVEVPGERIASIVQPATNPVVIEDDGDVDIEADDFVVIGDCQQAALFRVTAVGTAGGEITLARGTGGGIYENNGEGLSPEIKEPYGDAVSGQGATVSRVLTDIYFVADGTGTNNRGDTPLSLWRKTSAGPPVELVRGIEDLQVLFGIDNTPTNSFESANQYVPFEGVDDKPIRALRISVTANSVDVVADGDQLRRTFSQTISFRNS